MRSAGTGEEPWSPTAISTRHHPSVAAFGEWAAESGMPVLGIDIIPGSKPIETYDLPRECIMFFGQEGPGMSDEAPGPCGRRDAAHQPSGSTRSINASARQASRCMHGSGVTNSGRFRRWRARSEAFGEIGDQDAKATECCSGTVFNDPVERLLRRLTRGA